MRRIALYMTTVLEHSGGLEKYLIETAANLSKYPDVIVDVITMDNRVTDRLVDWQSVFYMRKIDKKLSYKESLENIKDRLGKAQYFKEPNIASLRKRLQQYDVIYSKNELIEGFVFKFLIRYKTVPPVVFGGHTPIHYPKPSSFHAKLHNFLYSSFIYKFLASGVFRFHTLNSYEAAFYKKLFPKKDVRKIYNPFDIDAFRRKARDHPYKMNGFDETKLNILWVGRLTEQKGIRDLVSIIQSVNGKLQDTKTEVIWNIVGDGEDREIVESLSQSESNVRFYGFIDQQYIASIYSQHNILLNTSHWEGYPYTLIEAQAFGLSIFAFDIPGVNDILNAYKGGHIVEGLSSMIDRLSVLINDKKVLPRSAPSDQFEPKIIYTEILNLLDVKK